MDMTTVATVLGSNFFIAATSIVVGVIVPYVQMGREREREGRERRREIRSEPLLKLRGELAWFGAKTGVVGALKEVGQSSEEYRKVVFEISNHILEGEPFNTLYTLDEREREIIERVNGLLTVWIQLTSDGSQLDKLTSDSEEKILKIQALINKRLEEL